MNNSNLILKYALILTTVKLCFALNPSKAEGIYCSESQKESVLSGQYDRIDVGTNQVWREGKISGFTWINKFTFYKFGVTEYDGEIWIFNTELNGLYQLKKDYIPPLDKIHRRHSNCKVQTDYVKMELGEFKALQMTKNKITELGEYKKYMITETLINMGNISVPITWINPLVFFTECDKENGIGGGKQFWIFDSTLPGYIVAKSGDFGGYEQIDRSIYNTFSHSTNRIYKREGDNDDELHDQHTI